MNNRNYGIDLLRIISMFMVVILHILGQGGVYKCTLPLSGAYETAWLLEAVAICSVDCFGLISGYVGVETKCRSNKIISMWIRVVFYTLIITGCFSIMFPLKISRELWLKTIFPVSTSQYWYFRDFFCMFFFIPCFNKVLNSLEEKEILYLGSVIILIFSVWQTVINKEIFGTEYGYSFLWLSLLYILGGIIRKLNNKIALKKNTYAIIFFFGVLLTWGCKYVMEAFLYESPYANVLFNYTSPTVLLCAIALLMFFKEIKFKNDMYNKFISIVAPSAFSVYLIHTHPLIYEMIGHRFDYVAEYSPLHLTTAVISIALLIYLGCTIIDMIRIKFFKWLKIDEISIYLDKLIKQMLLLIGFPKLK